MPGWPKLNELIEKIEELGGEDYVWDRLASGDSPHKIATDLGCSRGLLYKWRNLEREHRTKKWQEARAEGAESWVDDGLQTLDELAEQEKVSSAEVQLATSRANYRSKMAAMFDRDRFGDAPQQQVNVNVSLPNMHLDALRAVCTPTTQALPAETKDADYEIEGED